VAKASKTTKDVNVDRRTKERRETAERRKKGQPVKEERRKVERREKVNRRRQIDPTTCERDYTSDEIDFMQALDEYKRQNGRMFPTCSEILEVIRDLGYVKMPAGQLPSDAETNSDTTTGVADRDDAVRDRLDPESPAQD